MRWPDRVALMVGFLHDPIATVDRRFRRYGDLYRVEYPGAPLFVTKRPDAIRDILASSAFGKGHSSFRVLRSVLGDSLLTSEGETWRRQRRLVQPAFARPRLAEYAAVMAEEALAETDRLAGNRPRRVDMSATMTDLTLRIVARTLFGQRIEDSARIARAMTWLNKAFARPDFLPRSLPTPTRMRLRRSVRDLDEAVFALLSQRREQITRREAPPSDLLQRLLDARDSEGDGAGLSDAEIRDQLITLYLAGHDTTSHALSWTLYLLARHPEVLATLRREVDARLAGRTLTFDDLEHLPYTLCVLKEAMRLYPPVVAIPRRSTEACTVGGYPAPAGSEAIVWVFHVHRDGRYYRAPDTFRPEHFSPEESAQRPKHAYLPFGAGQRACVGQMFAMFEAQLILATMVSRLDFRYAGRRPAAMRFGVTLAPKNGLPMWVARR